MHRQYPLTDKIKIQRIPYCRNSYKIQEKNRRNRQTNTSNAQIHDRSLSCFGTCALIQTGGVKLALWAQTSNLSSMFADYVEKIYPIEYESKILHIHACLFHRFTSETDVTISEIDINKMLHFFLLTTYLLCLVNVFFKRKSLYLCVETVHLFSPTCSFIRMRLISFRGF